MAWGASGQEMVGRQRQEARKGEGVLYLLYAVCARCRGGKGIPFPRQLKTVIQARNWFNRWPFSPAYLHYSTAQRNEAPFTSHGKFYRTKIEI